MSSHKVKVERLKARAKAILQHAAMPVAGVSWLSSDLRPKHAPSSMRVTVAMDQAGVFKVKIINGGDTEIMDFNEGNPLVPNAIYVFEFMVHHGDSVNYLYSTTDGTIQVLNVEEIDSSVI